MMVMVKRIAITGGIACGKSLVGQFLQQLGADVLDADAVVHQLEAAGGAAVLPIQNRFGSGVVNSTGAIDRERLATVVFNDACARADLQAIVHPLVRTEIQRWLMSPRIPPAMYNSAVQIKAALIPLLFECGWQDDWDQIVCVASDEAVQIDRLMRFRGFSAEQARQRICAQMPVVAKAARSHHVIINNSSQDMLAKEVERVYRLLVEKSE